MDYKSRNLLLLFVLLSTVAVAQDNPTYANYNLSNMDSMLEGIYNSVISSASTFVSIASVIGVVGAVIMISQHIFTKLLRSQAVDWASLTRPLVILLGLVFYLPLLSFINTLLSPTVYATKGMVQNENAVVEKVLERLADARAQTVAYAIYVGEDGWGDFDKYLEVNDLVDDTGYFGLHRVGQTINFRMEAAMYKARNEMRMNVFWLMGWLYSAAVFIINTIRSFTLAVLGLIGPLALAFSLWPGFQASFMSWVGRYITVYLWLPVANIFGFIIGLIQVQFANIAIQAANAGGTTDTGFTQIDGLYFILLLTGIVGYFAVPTVTTYMISASGATAFAGGMSGAGRIGAGLGLLGANRLLQAAARNSGGATGGGLRKAAGWAGRKWQSMRSGGGGASSAQVPQISGPQPRRLPEPKR